MEQNPNLQRADRDNVAYLTFAAPENINALSEDMIAALSAALDDIAADRSVRAVVIRSSGKHFSAGHNLKELTARRADPDGGRQFFLDAFANSSAMNMKIQRMPQPVIAEVRGIATAAGCQLVAVCDLAVAADTARFATSGVNIGLFCSTPMATLSRNVPRKHAMEMLLLGDFLTADRVAQLGLVNRVVAEDELEDEVTRVAQTIASKSPAAVGLGKQAFYDQLEMPLEQALAYTGKVMAENMMARDAEEGIGAFIAKRPMPDWTGE